jgi:hypothetical protein
MACADRSGRLALSPDRPPANGNPPPSRLQQAIVPPLFLLKETGSGYFGCSFSAAELMQ